MATEYTIRFDPDFAIVTTDAETARWESENVAYVTAKTGGA